MLTDKKKRAFVDSKVKAFGDTIFDSPYVSKDNPQRYQLISEIERKYPGFSDFVMRKSDLTEENLHKQATTKLMDLANSFFSEKAEARFSDMQEAEPISQEFLDKYHEVVLIDELDAEGNIVYEESYEDVIDEFNDKIGRVKIKIPKKKERLMLAAEDDQQFLAMVNEYSSEIIERGYVNNPPIEESKTLESNNTDLDKLVFDKIEELVRTGKLQYGEGENTKTINFGRDVNRLIAKGSLSSEFEANLGRFLEEIGVRKEIQPIKKTHNAMVNGVMTPVTQTLEYSKYVFLGNNKSNTNFNGLAKALTVPTGGKNPDGTDAQLAPLWISKIRESYSQNLDKWLTDNNISSFDIDAKGKFMSFFNDQVQNVTKQVKEEGRDIRALTHIQDWSYNLMADPTAKPEQQPNRLQEAMNNAYYADKGEFYNQSNNNSQPVLQNPQQQQQLNFDPNQQQPQQQLQNNTTPPDTTGELPTNSSLDELYGFNNQ